MCCFLGICLVSRSCSRRLKTEGEVQKKIPDTIQDFFDKPRHFHLAPRDSPKNPGMKKPLFKLYILETSTWIKLGSLHSPRNMAITLFDIPALSR